MSGKPVRTIVHVDMDSFFVSVERLLDPSLEGKPVLVGGDPSGRGVVSSASYEARQFGCRSAMPMNRALRLCPNAVVVRGTHSRYVEFSHQVQTVFEHFSPLVEMASLDEAYIDLTGTERLWGSAWKACETLRNTVLSETRLPCSLGLATNKLVAKVASSLCKPAGSLRILPGEEAAFLAPLALRKLPGIGPKTAERLSSFGLERIGDIVALGVDTLEGLFGSNGRDLWERAQGRYEAPVEPVRETKSIGREHTFSEDIDAPDPIVSMLSHLSELVATSLREEELQSRTITLKFRYADFQTHTASRTLLEPTDDEGLLLSVVRDLLKRNWTRRVRLRLVGVSCSNLSRSSLQLDLFDRKTAERRERLHLAIDAIRDRHGFQSIERGRSLGSTRSRKPQPPASPETPDEQV